MRLLSVMLLVTAGCAAPAGERDAPLVDPLAPFVQPAEAPDPPARTGAPSVLIQDATVMTAAGKTFAPGYILMRGGLIEAVGPGRIEPPPGVTVVSGKGKVVTPGIIDSHSHIGVFPIPSVEANADGNEDTSPVTPEVWAEHAFWPQDPSIRRAIAGGVTAIQVLPGSTNLIGGRSFVAKLHPATSARAMRFSGAPQGLKMACGENVKLYSTDAPATRMGSVAGYRRAFQEALEYRRALRRHAKELARWKLQADEDRESEDPPDPPPRDLGLETLAKVLDGEILPHVHCYRADEMHLMLDLAREFGFEIRSFHHALEAYKLADRLASENVAASTWSDWWGFKMEAYDGIPENAAILAAAGGRPIIHSDSADEIRHLNQEAAKAMAAGRQFGLAISDDEALRWITANPAWAIGVDDRTGTLETGKMADVVLWNGDPFSVYTLAEKVYIDGALEYDRSDPSVGTLSDFELGQPARGGDR